MKLSKLLYNRVKDVLTRMDKKDVYALFFGIGFDPESCDFHFVVGCGREGVSDSDRWHLAVSADSCIDLIGDKESTAAVDMWLLELEHDSENGNGYALIQEGVKIASALFEEGFIKKTFGKDIPIIFDDANTSWYSLEATENANPDGLAAEFLQRKRRRSNTKSKGSFVDAAMNSVGILGVVSYFPNTLFMILVTLIAGGVHFPLTGGGIAKLVLFGLSLLSVISKAVQTKDEGGTALQKIAVIIGDLILACIVTFSCNFIVDRLAAGIALFSVVLWSVADMKKNKAKKQ